MALAITDDIADSYEPNSSPSAIDNAMKILENIPTSLPKSSNVKESHSRKGRKMRPKSIRKPRTLKAGTRALQEIRRMQKSTDLIIPRKAFARIVKEILRDFGKGDFRIQSSALSALQESVEARVIAELGAAQLCAFHAKRVTLQAKDMQLVRSLRNEIIDY